MEKWIEKLGEYIFDREKNKDALLEAAELVDNKEITEYFKTIHAEPSPENLAKGQALAEILHKASQIKEADAIELLALSSFACSAQVPEEFNIPDKTNLIKLAFFICDKCVNISEQLALKSCTALFANILGTGLAKLKFYNQARSYFEKASNLYRELAKSEPHIYRPNLAKILHGLGNIFKNQRNLPAAREAYSKSLEIKRDFANGETDAYLPDIADILNILGTILNDQKDFPAARKAHEEALSIYRKLAKKEPHIYLSAVAMTLNNIGVILKSQNNFSAAINIYKKALNICRKIKGNPHIYATTLNNLGNIFCRQRDFSAAKKAFNTTLKIYRNLVKHESHTYLPYVARTLHNLGNVHRDQRDFPAARDVVEKARNIYRELAKQEPDIYLAYLAGTFNNLGIVSKDQRDSSAAQKAYKNALSIYRKLAKKEPLSYLSRVAGTLNNLGSVFNNPLQAKNAYNESIQIYRELAKQEPYLSLEICGIISNLIVITPDSSEKTTLAKSSIDALRKGWQTIENDKKYIYKHRTIPCLKTLLQDVASSKGKSNPERMLPWLKALRDGPYLPDKDNPNITPIRNGLSEALKTAATTAKTTHASVLFIEALWDSAEVLSGNALVGLFRSDGSFECELCPAFFNNSDQLFIALHEWQAAIINDSDENQIVSLVNKIRDLSKQTFDSLPGFAREALNPEHDGFVLLSCDDAYTGFPFEILKYGNEEDEYLGIKRILPRIHALFKSLDRLKDRDIGKDNKTAMIFADPSNNLPTSAAEGKHLEILLRDELEFSLLPENRAFIGSDDYGATIQNFIKGLKEKPDIVHYTGHGGEDSMGEYIALSPDSPKGRFYANDLREHDISFDNNPLFILNGCKIGRIESFGTQREDISGELLRRGAEAVISSPYILNDALGGIFTAIFYGHETSGKNIGERVMLARQWAYEFVKELDFMWPYWALYTFHGNPFARIAYQQSETSCKTASEQMKEIVEEI